jgi:hypothetical protein
MKSKTELEAGVKMDKNLTKLINMVELNRDVCNLINLMAKDNDCGRTYLLDGETANKYGIERGSLLDELLGTWQKRK